MNFWTLLRSEPRPMAFGLLHTAAATVGQTLLISLFLPGIKTSFGLGDAEISLIFTMTTFASAAALWKVGSWIDRYDLVRYALACGVLLAMSSALIAASPLAGVLVAGMLGLRLAGNGLLAHVAVTATARHFSRERGQALAIVLLGASLGEGLMPAVLVPLIAAWGWRPALAALGVFGLALSAAGALVVRDDAAFRTPRPRLEDIAVAPATTRRGSDAGDRRYFLLAAPLFAAMWICTTATIFHQAVIATAKGLSLHWFAVSFIAFAVVRAPVSLLSGRLVDKLGSAPLFCMHVVPMAIGTMALVVSDGSWVAPFFWLCTGITGGIGTVVQSTIVAERVPRERLGAARSVLGAAGIVASAIGPSLYGLALAVGASVGAILWTSIAFMAIATALGVIATRVS